VNLTVNRRKEERTYVDVCTVIVERSIRDTHKTGFLNDANQSWAKHQWLRLADDTEKVPARSEPNGFLQAASADITNRGSARVRQEKDGNGRLLERQQ
jgi:hypothetical protein